MTNLHLFPGGGTASSLPLSLMIIAIAANFAFGVLLNFGVGNFAPTLVMFSLMGMDPRYAFPIMAGGAALMGAAASIAAHPDRQDRPSHRTRPRARRHPGGPRRSLIVKSMPLEMLRWLVIIVVLYAAAVMFRAASLGRREHHPEGATAPVLE